MNKIQFTQKDIIDTFERINSMDEASRYKTLQFIRHELRGSHNPIIGFAAIVGSNPELDARQKEYIQHVEKNSELLCNALSETTSNCEYTYDNESKAKLVNQSKIIMQGLEGLVHHSPLTRKITEIGPVQESQIEYLEGLDLCIENSIYMHNQHFAPNFQKSEHHFDLDVITYAKQHETETINSAGIEYIHMPGIITKFDYFTKVLLPLIKNVNDHAYNEKNDIYGRLKDPDFKKKIEISGVESSNDNKEITIFVRDNGFGIDPKIKDKMFQKGASSRGEGDGHGLGMWLVKQFVEEDNHGTIGFNTTAGKGTTFYFTIPYDYQNSAMMFVKQ